MMNQVDYNLKPLQTAILDVFKAFAKICELHGFRYYAAYGTALGAIRHKGFIPWDDDFDVVMPREDYNKFVKVVRGELPNGLRFLRGGDGLYSGILLSRILDTREGRIEKLRAETGLELRFAPFIDIFVLESVPQLLPHMRRFDLKLRLWRCCQLWRYPETGYSVSRKYLLPVFKIIGLFVSLRFRKTRNLEDMMLLRDELCAAIPRGMHVYEPLFFRKKESRLLPFNYFEPSRIVPFEDTQIRVPGKVEEILSVFYGEYMKLPPPECRIPEHNAGKAWQHV